MSTATFQVSSTKKKISEDVFTPRHFLVRTHNMFRIFDW